MTDTPHERYTVFPRTLIFIGCGDDVLLQRRASERTDWPGKYNGVGGHIEADEDPLTGARREIWEETGLRIDELVLRGIANVPPAASAPSGKPGVLIIIYVARTTCREVSPSAEGDLEWVSRDELLTYDLIEDLEVLLPRILDVEGPPFYAHVQATPDGRPSISFAQLQTRCPTNSLIDC